MLLPLFRANALKREKEKEGGSKSQKGEGKEKGGRRTDGRLPVISPPRFVRPSAATHRSSRAKSASAVPPCFPPCLGAYLSGGRKDFLSSPPAVQVLSYSSSFHSPRSKKVFPVLGNIDTVHATNYLFQRKGLNKEFQWKNIPANCELRNYFHHHDISTFSLLAAELLD